MKFAFLNLGCPDWDMETVAARAVEYGYDGVELRSQCDNPYVYPDMPLALRHTTRTLFERCGIEICALASYSRFGAAESAGLEANRALLAQDILLAHDLGAPLVRTFLGEPEAGHTHAQMLELAAPYLNYCANLAATLNIKLAFETHDAWCSGELMRAAFEKINSPGAYVLWDIENNHAHGETAESFFNAIGAKCAHVHIRDSRRESDGVYHACLTGQGTVELEKCLALLLAAGFDGYVSFEWEKRWRPELANPKIVFPQFISYAHAMVERLSAAK